MSMLVNQPAAGERALNRRRRCACVLTHSIFPAICSHVEAFLHLLYTQRLMMIKGISEAKLDKVMDSVNKVGSRPDRGSLFTSVLMALRPPVSRGDVLVDTADCRTYTYYWVLVIHKSGLGVSLLIPMNSLGAWAAVGLSDPVRACVPRRSAQYNLPSSVHLAMACACVGYLRASPPLPVPPTLLTSACIACMTKSHHHLAKLVSLFNSDTCMCAYV